MKLQGRNLSAEMQGDDVKLLHQELRNLGYEVPKKEAEKAIFGASTRKIIIDFKKNKGSNLLVLWMRKWSISLTRKSLNMDP